MSMNEYSMPGYFQNMPVIGTPVAPNAENETELRAVEQEIHELPEAALDAGRSTESLNASGQWTAMQRIEALVDEGTFCPLNTLYNPEHNDHGTTGIVKGLGRVEGKWALIIASDNKKLAGAWIGGQAEDILRGTDTAKTLHIPVIYLLNCSGVKLDEQEKVYAGRRTGGTPFFRAAELAQLGVPILVGIWGTNPAGGGYHSISPTILIAHKDANMAVGGAGILSGMSPKGYVDLEGAKQIIEGTKVKVAAPGSIGVHFNETGFFREVYAEEMGVIEALKKYMSYLPAYNLEFFRVDDPREPQFNAEDLYSIVPMNQKKVYNSYEILARLIDNSEFSEYKKGYGPEMITGLAKIDGLLVGIVMNAQGILMNYPEYKQGAIGIGGKLYRQGLIKMSEFVNMCSRDKLPIIWVQDTTGIDVGDDAERAELLGLGQSLIYSIENSKVPQMEITLRKGSAAAHYVLGGPQGNNTNAFSIGTAATEIYVMHGETAASAMYSRRLAKDDAAGKDLQPTIDKMNDMIQEYYKKSRPKFCAEIGLVDEIVDLPVLRTYMRAFTDAAYQNPQAICAFHQMLLPRAIREFQTFGK